MLDFLRQEMKQREVVFTYRTVGALCAPPWAL